MPTAMPSELNSDYLLAETHLKLKIKSSPIVGMDEYSQGVKDERERCLQVITEAPKVDAVRVIRCPHCRSSECVKNPDESSTLRCRRTGLPVPSDGYCYMAIGS